MKKIIASILIATTLVGCGVPMDYAGKTYPTYGIVNEDENKSNKMCYKVSIGNVVWSIILIETIIAPVYFIGWSLWEPVRVKPESGKCGIDG